MIVLARKVGQRIVIGEKQQEVLVTVISLRGGRVRLGVEADASISVQRIEPDKVTPTDLVR